MINNNELKNESTLKLERLNKQAMEFSQKKIEILKNITKEHLNMEFSEDELQEIYIRMENDFDNIKNNILVTFNNLFENIIDKQRNGTKKPIEKIYMSFLRTRLLEGRGMFLIEAFDENIFLDDVETNILLDFDFVYESHFNKAKELIELKEKYREYIREEDITMILLESSVKYFIFIADIMVQFINRDITKLQSFKDLNKGKKIEFNIGFYRASAYKICEYEI